MQVLIIFPLLFYNLDLKNKKKNIIWCIPTTLPVPHHYTMVTLTDWFFSAIAPLHLFLRVIGFDLHHRANFKRKRLSQLFRMWCILSIFIDFSTGLNGVVTNLGPIINTIVNGRPNRVADLLLEVIQNINKMLGTLSIHLIMVFKVGKALQALLNQLGSIKSEPTKEDFSYMRRLSIIGRLWIILTVKSLFKIVCTSWHPH